MIITLSNLVVNSSFDCFIIGGLLKVLHMFFVGENVENFQKKSVIKKDNNIFLLKFGEISLGYQHYVLSLR